MPRSDDDRSGQVLRVMRVLRELTASPWTLRELAEHLGEEKRNVYRDISLLRRLGVQFVVDGWEYHADRDSVRVALGFTDTVGPAFRIAKK